MKNKLFLLTIVVIVVGIFLMVFFKQRSGGLVSPNLSETAENVVSTPVPTSISVPKTFQFDSSTDLKKELDNVNPQVLDSDF